MWGGTTGPDGRRWWIGRRWLPWRPRRRVGRDGGDGRALDFANAAPDDPVGCLVVVVIGLLLAFPLLLAVVFLAVEWLLVLLLLPAAVLIRAAFGKPWMVVARCRTPEGRRWRYAREVRGWRASGELIAAARREITEYGEPRSLGAAVAAEMPETPPAPDTPLVSGTSIMISADVHGFDSPYARDGWLGGRLTADHTSLALSQDGAGLARRVIPVQGGCRDFSVGSPTRAERAVVGGRVVIRFTGADGRAYRLAVDPEAVGALRTLAVRWAGEG